MHKVRQDQNLCVRDGTAVLPLRTGSVPRAAGEVQFMEEQISRVGHREQQIINLLLQ